MSQGPRRAMRPDDEPAAFADFPPPPPGAMPASSANVVSAAVGGGIVPPGAPSYPPPPAGSRPAAAPHRLPTAIKGLLAAMVALALVIVCIWAVGGFELRQTYDDKSPGEALNLGPAEITLDHAIGYQFGDDVSIEVAGSCGLTADQSAGSVQYAIQDGAYAGMRTDGDPLISTESMLSLGTDDGLSFDTTRDVLSPGVPPIPCVLRFTLPPETMGQDEVTVLIAKLQFGEQGNVKNDAETSKTWNPAPDGYRVTFPISWTIR